MIIDNKDAKQELLYTAYGFTVYGIVADYEWTYDGSGRREKCLTSISINDSDNKELCNRNLGNNCIFMRIFNENIDNILWYLNKENITDSWIINNDIVQKILISNNSVLPYQIKQRRDREQREEQNNKQIAERQAVENENRKAIQNYCDKKKLYCKFIYNDLYVFKINKDVEKVTELLNNADSKHMDSYIDYATKYPNNELTIVYIGTGYKDINTILTELKQVA